MITNSTNPRVVAVGEAMIELSSAGEHTVSWTFAGDTLNSAAAIATANPDADVRYLTGIGDDEISGHFLEFCSGLGVDAANSPMIAGRNLGLYWISTDHGERSFRYWRNESAARQVLRSGIRLPDANEIDAVVMSAITLAVAGPGTAQLLKQVAALRHRGVLVCFDGNYRPALWPDAAAARKAAEEAAAAADVVVYSADDARALWGETADAFCDRMTAVGVAEILVTDGPHPVIARIGDERLVVQPPAIEVVDTTGAGDAFFGTYLGQRLAGVTPAAALDRAVEVSSIVVRTPGALTYLRR